MDSYTHRSLALTHNQACQVAGTFSTPVHRIFALVERVSSAHEVERIVAELHGRLPHTTNRRCDYCIPTSDRTFDMSAPTLKRANVHRTGKSRNSGLAVLLDAEGAVLFGAAEVITDKDVAMAVRYSSGLINAAMFSDDLDRLRIPDQPVFDSERNGLRFTVAVDAVGVGTGISAIDRAHTLRTLADPSTIADDLRRPGHVLPVRCRRDTIGEYPHTVYEHALRAVSDSGHAPVALVCRLVQDHGPQLTDVEARLFAEVHKLTVLS